MAHQQATQSHALPIENQVTYLSVHLLDCALVHLGIVLHPGQASGGSIIGILHIRHVNVNYAVQNRQNLWRVVASGIIDQRQRQTIGHRQFQGFQYLGHLMGGTHQVYVVATSPLEV
jgi:hypothetical protein